MVEFRDLFGPFVYRLGHRVLNSKKRDRHPYGLQCKIVSGPIASYAWKCQDCEKTGIGRNSFGGHRKSCKAPKEISAYKNASNRRKAMIRKHGLVCWICKLSEWMGRPIPIQVDHIDGNSDNNSEENLRLLCANCHAQTDTFCGKNKGRYETSRNKSRKRRDHNSAVENEASNLVA